MTNADDLATNTAYTYDYDYSRVPADLERLENLEEFEIADGEPDPRGFDVIGLEGKRIGQVESLLASPSEGKALYAIVDTGGWFEDRKFVLPLNRLSFDTDEGKTYGPFTKEMFENAPAYLEGEANYVAYTTYWNDAYSGEDLESYPGSRYRWRGR